MFIVNKYDRDDASFMVKSIKNVVASTKKDSADKQIFKTSCKTGNGIEELANALIKSHSSINKNERQ
jgi:LAO/AO transport system kinase